MSEGVSSATGGRARPAGDGMLAAAIGAAVRSATGLRTRLAGATRGIRTVVTPVGVGVAAAALALLALGFGFGWAEAVGLGAALAALLVVALAGLAGRGATAVELELPADRVAVGRPAVLLLRSESTRRRLTGVRLEIPVGERLVHRTLPRLPRGGAIDEELSLPTERRGVVPIGPVRTVRGDVLGLMRREIVWSGSVLLHVHPRILSIPSLGAGFRHDLEGVTTADLTPDDVAFHSLREYLPGDDRRFIHWRSSAKTGRFMVQQFEETRRSQVAVVLDAEPAAYLDPEEFELAVGVVGSLGVRAIRDGRALDVWTSAPAADAPGRPQALPSVVRDRLLDALSIVEIDPAAVRLAEAARAAAEGGAAVSLAFLVTGSARSAAELRTAAGRFAPGVDVVVVECAPAVRPAVRVLSGTSVYTVGYLEDLRRMLVTGAAA